MKQYNVIIPTTVKPYPDMYEVTVVRILAENFGAMLFFIERSAIRTPDVQVIKTKQFWEIKNVRVMENVLK